MEVGIDDLMDHFEECKFCFALREHTPYVQRQGVDLLYVSGMKCRGPSKVDLQ